jgi:hypothetical protein
MGRDGDWIRAGTWYPAEYGLESGDDEDETEDDEDDWEDEEGLDDEWPDDSHAEADWTVGPDGLPGTSWAAGPDGAMGPGGAMGLGAGYGEGWGRGGVSGFPVLVAVAVMAAIAGAAAGFFLIRGASAASAAGGATPSVSAPASVPASAPASSGGGAGTGLPGLPGNASGNGQLRMLLTGRVLAVSGTSITIGGAGPSVTASVSSATKITGRAHAIAGVKVGDEVAAQITGTPGHLVISTLQDPAK